MGQGGRREDGRRRPVLLPVGKFFGVPIYFAPSWVIIAVIITITYAPLIEDQVYGLRHGAAYLLALGYAVLFALCILLHELGHVAVSLVLKIPVRRVVIFLLGGVSTIDEPQRPRDEFLVSVAGPVVSLLLAALALLGTWLTDPHTVLNTTVLLLTVSNLVVGVFNLLPGLPLDGGRLVRAGAWAVSGRKVGATVFAAWAGRVVAVAFVGFMVWVTGWSGVASLPSIVFTVLLAGFIWLGAGQSLRVARFQERIPALRVADLVRRAVEVPPATPLAESLRRTWDVGARAVVVLGTDGRPSGIVSEARVGTVPVERRPWVATSDVAVALQPGSVLPETLEGETLLSAVQAHPAEEYLVVRVDGTTVGVLTAADVAAALQGAR